MQKIRRLFLMGSKNFKNTKETNYAVQIVSKTKKNIMGLAVESEVGPLFQNGKEEEPICITLNEMVTHNQIHPCKQTIPLQMSLTTIKVSQKQSKVMYMRFYSIHNKIKQDNFRAFYKPGTTKLEDYFTNHKPTHHHR